MALRIEDPRTEALAARLAELTSDTRTGAIRTALEERLRRLTAAGQRDERAERVRAFLLDEAWPQVPVHVLGGGTGKDVRERLLGIGPDGV